MQFSSVSVGSLGPGVQKVCLSPLSILLGSGVWFWMQFHPSYHLAGASPLRLGVGIFLGGNQHSPVEGHSAVSCSFGVLAGEGSAYSSIPPYFWGRLRLRQCLSTVFFWVSLCCMHTHTHRVVLHLDCFLTDVSLTSWRVLPHCTKSSHCLSDGSHPSFHLGLWNLEQACLAVKLKY